jgi:protein involved in polysaccharide export with SLBB domain
MIDSGGFTNLPNLGRLNIAGLSTGAAQSAIENAYKAEEVYTNPTIIITMQAQSRWVNVGGELKSPQRIPFTPDRTILASINAAGGFSNFADQHKVRLLRGSQVMIIDAKKYAVISRSTSDSNPVIALKFLKRFFEDEFNF